MSIEFFNRRPGSDIGQGSDDPTMLAIGITPHVGTLIRVPAGVGALSGTTRKVEAVSTLYCPDPRCPRGTQHRAFDMGVDNGVRYYVIECVPHNQFIWVTRRVEVES